MAKKAVKALPASRKTEVLLAFNGRTVKFSLSSFGYTDDQSRTRTGTRQNRAEAGRGGARDKKEIAVDRSARQKRDFPVAFFPSLLPTSAVIAARHRAIKSRVA